MPRKTSISRFLLAVSLLFMSGCLEETPALFIVSNSALSSSCQPVASTDISAIVSRGVMDLTVATTYHMFPNVENLMESSGSSSLGGGLSGTEGNRVTLQRADVTFVPEESLSVAMPNRTIPISGTLEPGGRGVVELEVIHDILGDSLSGDPRLRDRGSTVFVEVHVQFIGVTTSGTSVESNLFTFPMELCRGCLLDFPLEANDPLDTQPNCRAESGESGTSTIEMPCLPGQDETLDCRICRVLLLAQGAPHSEIELQCEPGN